MCTLNFPTRNCQETHKYSVSGNTGNTVLVGVGGSKSSDRPTPGLTRRRGVGTALTDPGFSTAGGVCQPISYRRKPRHRAMTQPSTCLADGDSRSVSQHPKTPKLDQSQEVPFVRRRQTHGHFCRRERQLRRGAPRHPAKGPVFTPSGTASGSFKNSLYRTSSPGRNP